MMFSREIPFWRFVGIIAIGLCVQMAFFDTLFMHIQVCVRA